MNNKLKNARLGRAEDLSEETRKKYNLPPSGLVAIQTTEVLDLNKEIILIDEGINSHLKSFGDFKEIKFNPNKTILNKISNIRFNLLSYKNTEKACLQLLEVEKLLQTRRYRLYK